MKRRNSKWPFTNEPEVGFSSDGVSRLGLGLVTRLETRFLESRSRRSQVSSRSRMISVSSSSSRDFALVLFYEVLQEGVP